MHQTGAPRARRPRCASSLTAELQDQLGGAGLRLPPHKPDQYSKALVRPTWSGCLVSHCEAYVTTTSFASSAAPSWNFTLSRSLQVQTDASLLGVQDSASAGTASVPPNLSEYSDSKICSQARSVSPSVSSGQKRLRGSAFCIQTSVSRSAACIAAKISVPSGDEWAPSTSALKAVPEAPWAMITAGTCCLIRLLASV